MLEKLTYINHLNELFECGDGSDYLVEQNDLHDFAWEVTSKNNRVSALRRGVTTKTLTILIVCKDKEEGYAKRNELFEFCEKDVLALQHGKIVIGDYYLKCFITGSKKEAYYYSKRYMKVTMTVTTDFPNWVKENAFSFNYGSGGSAGKDLDFNRDFPSDYTSNLLGKTVNNTGLSGSNFLLSISGPCINPVVTIAGHEYHVEVSVQREELLEINSIEKTVILTKADGTKQNCFNLRDRDSYIFEKIPEGTSAVSSSAHFRFDLTVFDERSEPKWI